MLVVVILSGIVVLLTLIWVLQRGLIYFPASHLPSITEMLPGAEEVAFETEDGLTLQAWFLPARSAAAEACVLVFNGNAGNRAYRAPIAEMLASAGFDVLLFDYRGYGGNPGRPSESGLLLDARAARAYLDRRYPDGERQIIYYGESLGTGIAVALAAERAPAALILRSPFTSLVDVGRAHYPFLPVGLLLRDRYDSVRTIRQIDCPLLVVAGDRDRIVPARLSRELFEAAPQQHKRFFILEGADHNDPALALSPRIVDEILRFLR